MGFLNPLKLGIFLNLLLDPDVGYRVPHENELQSTYHDWRTNWTDGDCAVKSENPSVDAVNEKSENNVDNRVMKIFKVAISPIVIKSV